MKQSLDKILQGYKLFRERYAHDSLMKELAQGQNPDTMIVACCDSRVDPAVLLQCDPGELFVHRNVANIVPPYEKDNAHHGTSAALEYAVCYLKIKHLIIMGHSQCGGVTAMVNDDNLPQNDFIGNWVSLIQQDDNHNIDSCAKEALLISKKNLMTFPWIAERVKDHTLMLHFWFFDIKKLEILAYNEKQQRFLNLEI